MPQVLAIGPSRPPLTKGAFEMTDSKILTKVVIALGGNDLQSK